MAGDGRRVQSIEVGGRLLAVLADAGGPLMLRDIARRAGLSPAQAHSYMVSFRRLGLVDQDAAAGRYRLGPFALSLAIARMRSFDPYRRAANAVADLAVETGLTVFVVVWGSYGPTVLQVQEAADQIHTSTRPGTVFSVSGTASGRAFAAFLPDDLIRSAVADERRDPQPRRIGPPAAPEALTRAVIHARQYGYTRLDRPVIPGVNAIAAPVFDHAGQMQMAITLVGGVGTLIDAPGSPQVGDLLRFTAQLSREMGWRGPPAARTATAAALADGPAD